MRQAGNEARLEDQRREGMARDRALAEARRREADQARNPGRWSPRPEMQQGSGSDAMASSFLGRSGNFDENPRRGEPVFARTVEQVTIPRPTVNPSVHVSRPVTGLNTSASTSVNVPVGGSRPVSVSDY